MLRIVSKADTAESFIQIFSHLCDRDSLFIVTRSPKAIGTETRFSVNLKTGEPLIKGHGTVTERFEDRQNPYGRVGMKLRFVELDDKSREFIERLVSAREEAQTAKDAIPPDLALGTAATEPASSGPKPETAKAKADRKEAGESSESSGEADSNPQPTPGEERARGSDFILPANPFGELTDNVLEAFIECSLYEDMTGISGQENKSDGESDGGGWGFFQPVQERANSPSTGQAAPGQHAQNFPIPSAPSPFATVPSGGNARSGSEHAVRTPPGMPAMQAPATEPAMQAPAMESAMQAPTVESAVQQSPGMIPGAPGLVTPPGLPAQPMAMPAGPMAFQNEPMPQAASPVQLGGYPVAGARPRRSNRNAIAIAVVVAVVLATLASLGVGYVLWGGKDNSDKQGGNETSAAPDTQDDAAEVVKGEGNKAGAQGNEVGGDKVGAEGDKAGAEGNTAGADEGDQAGAEGDTAKGDTAGAESATAEGDTAGAEGDTAEQGRGDGTEANPGGEDSAAVANQTDGTECQVQINSKPEQASVFAGDRKLGDTPLETTLPCGQVELRFTRQRRDPTVETVKLRPGQVNKIDVDLKRPTVELVIKSSPAGAAVYFNGKYRGKAPVTLQVPGYRAGKLEVKKLGYRTLKKRVYPKGPSSTVTASLKKLGR